MTASARAVELSKAAAAAAADVKGDNILALDVTGHLALSDVFVLASGSNERQVTAIAERIEEELAKQGAKAVRREGVRMGRWALLDFNEIIVHVMHQEERAYYELERLWKDCPVIPVDAAA